LKVLVFSRFSLWHVSCVMQAHVGLDFHPGNGRLLRRQPRLRGGVSAVMSTWELILGSAGAVLLTAYLVYALLRPERF
jgi:K+-transporting ATPase KdpF subunit